jgi:hypothetical protein
VSTNAPLTLLQGRALVPARSWEGGVFGFGQQTNPARLLWPARMPWLVILGLVCASVTQAQACTRADFEDVVDRASSTLVELAQANTPTFQERLRRLKDKRGWSQEQFVREGAPFVRDDVIQKYDETAQALLLKINAETGVGANCDLLTELRRALAALVETQTAKWAYMFDKIERALAQ